MTDDEIIAKAGSHWQRTRGTMRDYLLMVIKTAREDERERLRDQQGDSEVREVSRDRR